MSPPGDIDVRAAVFAALGEPARLTIVDRLVAGDLSPGELASELGIGTNLMAHHLRVLDDAGVIRRVRSEGDKRRSYVALRDDNPVVWAAALAACVPAVAAVVRRVVFVCSANSARSQLAAALWNQLSTVPAASAGTHPGPRVHPGAVAAAHRHGLNLAGQRPSDLTSVLGEGDLVVVVCDQAHEELDPGLSRLHWSVPDPVRVNTDTAFERSYAEIDRRVHRLVDLAAS